MSGALTIANGQRRRGREEQYVSDACYLWRISAVVQGLHRLLDLAERGERTSLAVHNLTVLEHRVEQMLTEAQRAAILRALPEREETDVCDGS